MKKSFSFGMLAAALIAAMPMSADAWQGGHGGYGGYRGYGAYYGGGYRGYGGYPGWGWGGFAAGVAVAGLAAESAYMAAYPYYGASYYPPYYAQPVSAAPVYVPPAVVQQQPLVAAPPPTSASWYYCRASKAYYPYVQTCKAGWQTVPTVPPGM